MLIRPKSFEDAKYNYITLVIQELGDSALLALILLVAQKQLHLYHFGDIITMRIEKRG